MAVNRVYPGTQRQRICGVITGPLGRNSRCSQDWQTRTALGPG
jgi:hypothetical protein